MSSRCATLTRTKTAMTTTTTTRAMNTEDRLTTTTTTQERGNINDDNLLSRRHHRLKKPIIRFVDMPFLYGAVIFVAALTFGPASGESKPPQQKQPPGCPANCECDENLSSTVCSRRNLTAIPSVPVTSLYAYFDRNVFTDSHLSPQNFTSIPYVRGLYLKGCGISSFEVGTFSDLKFLRELDLSYNKIAFIPRGAFANLQLEFLDLGHNPAIRLMPDSFCGAAITRLSLKCCDLETINVQTFHPLFDSITSLTLSCNDLDTIPAPLVWSPSHLNTLNIADNPRLTCDCNMLWISRRLALQKQLFKVDYLFPKGCSIESLVIQTAAPDDSTSSSAAGSNCSTDAVMLKDIDYGLCIRALESIKALAAVTPPLPPVTSRPRRNKTTTAFPRIFTAPFTTTPTATAIPQQPEQTDEQTDVPELDDLILITAKPTERNTIYPSTITGLSAPEEAIVNDLAAVKAASSTNNESVNFTVRCSEGSAQPSLPTKPTTTPVPVNPALRYTRAHMFVACVASATFTFITAVLCYCANRICSSWLGEHRQKISASRREPTAWGRATCTACSSSQGAPSDSSTRQISTTTTTTTTTSGGRYKNGGMPLRPSISFPSDGRSSSLSSDTSSPLCVIHKGGAAIMAPPPANKQTLHVRIAGSNKNMDGTP